MARVKLRRKAISLRKKGLTYSEIRQKLHLAKSTLSDWLQDLPLTSSQLSDLAKHRKKNKLIAIEKTRNIKHIKHEKRLKLFFHQEKKRLLPLNDKELEMAGLFLYLGEGTKRLNGSLSLNNTDPLVMQFYLTWLIHSLKIPLSKIKVNLHLYKDMEVEKEKKYWSKLLQIHLMQFTKPYIKNSLRSEIDHKGYGHGTCGLSVNSVLLKEKVIMGIKAILEKYSVIQI